jgi:hypothetical protein
LKIVSDCLGLLEGKIHFLELCRFWVFPLPLAMPY